jgi:hypothetical protein
MSSLIPAKPTIHQTRHCIAAFHGLHASSFSGSNRLGRQRVDLGERKDLGPFGEIVAIGFQLAAHGFPGGDGVLAGRVDEMQEGARALDMAEEAVAEADALMRALDQAGNVGNDEFALVDAHDAELRMQRGEGIVGDLGLGRGDRREKRRLAGVRQADQPGIGDQFQPQADGALLRRLAGIGAARRAVGRRLEMRVAEAAIAAFDAARCAGRPR